MTWNAKNFQRFVASAAFNDVDQRYESFVCAEETSTIVQVFSKAFLAPSTTLLAIEVFSPHLLSLVQRTMSSLNPSTRGILPIVALCRLVCLRPALTCYVEEQLASLPKALFMDFDDRVSTTYGLSKEDAFICMTRALLSGTQLPLNTEDWNKLLLNENEIVRWCGIKAITTLLSMSEEKVELLFEKFGVSTQTALSASIRCAKIDQDRVHNASDISLVAIDERSASRKRPLPSIVDELSLPAGFVDILGVTVPASKRSASKPQSDECRKPFILTSTAQRHLFSAALALSQNRSVLMEGPPGSGKTRYIQELARLTGNDDAIWIQIDDQMDVKSLIGAYVCTPTPGEFRWQPGPLAEAVVQGKWIVIEDINVAPSEVLATLVQLIEGRRLMIPQRAESLAICSGFQLIASITTEPKQATGSTYGFADNVKDLLTGLFACVDVESPSLGEQLDILRNMFPELTPLLPFAYASMLFLQCAAGQCKLDDVPTMQDGCCDLRSLVERCVQGCGGELNRFHPGRHFSLRDVSKWCYRLLTFRRELVHRLKDMETVDMRQLSFALREAALEECCDCYAAYIPSPSILTRIMHGFASLWCLTEQEVTAILELKKPRIMESEEGVFIGRSCLSVHRKTLKKDSCYVSTGHAARLMERVATSLQMNEAVLLVGETGTGKTATVQEIAQRVGAKLIVVNLSQQTDSSDLLGGYKPISAKDILGPLIKPFLDLMRRTWKDNFNESLATRVLKYKDRGNWTMLEKVIELALEKIHPATLFERSAVGGITKRQRLDTESSLKMEWIHFEDEFRKAVRFRSAVSASFAFQFVEGTLLRSLRDGYWLFLDEINLAPCEALHALAAVLESNTHVAVNPADKGILSVERHPNFRLIAAMNPATDFGKRDLAAPLRNKFTEFWFSEPESKEDLHMIVAAHLSQFGPRIPMSRIVEFYWRMKDMAKGELLDGCGQSPCYSLRTFCRFLQYVQKMLPVYGIQRTLSDGALAVFCTQLDASSVTEAKRWIDKILLENKAKSDQWKWTPAQPHAKLTVLFEQFWLETGSEAIPAENTICGKSFVLTPSIRANLRNLARAVSLGKCPVLLQGPTSSGKTTLVSFLAKQTGHTMVRINNHEHTDLQEYLGSYIADSTGQLTFVEGALLQAVRNGYWVVLDELNLAPTEVLEALNRLLDDNHELYVPDLQKTIKPHPHFKLFATQNPPRQYAGRKYLSRAFRSRFLELNVDDIPDDELAEIIEQRCQVPRSFATKMVSVMRELQEQRQLSNVFAGKHGFITPRDLFRWAERSPRDYTELARDGYFILAERLRNPTEKQTVLDVLCKTTKIQLNLASLYPIPQTPKNVSLQWISSTVRMFRLVERCLDASEAVLLIGETSTGKTSVCQALADLRGQRLHILNCNLHTETSDFIGGFRPVRDRSRAREQFVELLSSFESQSIWNRQQINMSVTQIDAIRPTEVLSLVNTKQTALTAAKERIDKRLATKVLSKKERRRLEVDKTALTDLQASIQKLRALASAMRMPFVWEDGVLVSAMKNGDMVLIDELNLADDSVLERMNSVLDVGRSLTLAEKGAEPPEVITAHPDFRIVATMNPGGDFGKKELSPALTNRFTQIWVSPIEAISELTQILDAHLSDSLVHKREMLDALMQFVSTFREWTKPYHLTLTIRDLLSVADFVHQLSASLGEWPALIHGIASAFLDGLEVNLVSQNTAIAAEIRLASYKLLRCLVPESYEAQIDEACGQIDDKCCQIEEDLYRLGPFAIKLGHVHLERLPKYDLSAPTPKRNLFRLLRAMQLKKSILLEGSPGVGKTSLVATLAAMSGHRLTRINLSEQTDMMDLLGADLPVPDGKAGEFRWRDGPLLSALRSGDWVLLDELNLANQQILEGLNALTDHRAQIFIPELNSTFNCPSSFRLFASQNPTGQGGGRKGLPRSFLNRFTRVYTEAFDGDDINQMSKALCGDRINHDMLSKMVHFLTRISSLCSEGTVGSTGGPWEFNLRDFLRWSALVEGKNQSNLSRHVMRAAEILIYRRFRKLSDRSIVADLFEEIFGFEFALHHPCVLLSDKQTIIGDVILCRNPHGKYTKAPNEAWPTLISHDDLTPNNHLSGMNCLVPEGWIDKKGCSVGVVDSRHDLYPLKHLAPYLESLAVCVDMNWPALVVGPSCSGKTCLIRQLAAICNKNLVEMTLTSGTDTSDLLGGFEKRETVRELQKLFDMLLDTMRSSVAESLTTLSRKDIFELLSLFGCLVEFQKQMAESTWSEAERLKKFHSFISSIQQRLAASSCTALKPIDPFVKRLQTVLCQPRQPEAGCFEWVDAALVKAMERGDWLLLDNANLCNATVLDRLNSVMELNGILHLNECGGFNGEARVIQPHPDFRLFMAYNPRHGEISRAMRNRSIETYIPQEISQVATRHETSTGCASLQRLWGASMMIGYHSAIDVLVDQHASTLAALSTSSPNVRDLREAMSIFRLLIQSGHDTTAALEIVCEQVYDQKDIIPSNAIKRSEVFEAADGSCAMDWMLRQLSTVQLRHSSAFASICREMAVMMQPYSTPSWQFTAARVAASRMNAVQLENVEICLNRMVPSLLLYESFRGERDLVQIPDSQPLAAFFANVKSKDLTRRFLDSRQSSGRFVEFTPLDTSYWSRPSIAGQGPAMTVQVFLKTCELQHQLQMHCKETNANLFIDNSILQLSYLRSTDSQFRPSFKNVHHLWLEWMFPAIVTLQEIADECLISLTEDNGSNIEDISALKKLSDLNSYTLRFFHQWSSIHPRDKSVIAKLESAIYIWMKIIKVVQCFKSLLCPERVAKWSIVSDGVRRGLELPEENSRKSLLWKYGGHPKQHHLIGTAEQNLKIRQISQMLSVGAHLFQNDPQQYNLLQELNLLQTIGSDVTHDSPNCEDEYVASILSLATHRPLRRYLTLGNLHLMKDSCRALLGALSIASLAAFGSVEEAEVVREALKMSMAEIEACREKAVGSCLPEEGYHYFLPASFMSSVSGRCFQLDLHRLHWTITCSRFTLPALPLLLHCCNIHRCTADDFKRIQAELKQRVEDGVERSSMLVTDYVAEQNMLWLIDIIQSDNDGGERSQQGLSLISDHLYHCLASSVLTQETFARVDHLNMGMDFDSEVIQGVSAMFAGSMSRATDALLTKTSAIIDTPARLVQLKCASRHLGQSLQSTSASQMSETLRLYGVASVVHIIASHLSSFPEQNREALKQLLQQYCRAVENDPAGNDCSDFPHLLRCLGFHLRQSHHSDLTRLSESHILPCCQLLTNNDSAKGLGSSTARAWILLGLSRMQLIMPPVGVDPATKHTFKADQLSFTVEQQMKPELEIRKIVQSIPGGFDETTRIEDLQKQITVKKEEIDALRKLTVARPNPSQYLQLHQSLYQYLSTHAAEIKIGHLMEMLERRQDGSIAAAQNWIDVSISFVKRLSTAHPFYMDVLQPFLRGVLEVCMGLGYLTTFTKHTMQEPVSDFLTESSVKLMAINPDRSITSLADEAQLEAIGKHVFAKLSDLGLPEERKEEIVFEVQLCCLRAALYASAKDCQSSRNSPSQLEAEQRFCAICKSLMIVFEQLEAYKDAKAAEEAQTFKTKVRTVSIEKDEEMDEASYKVMFPDHSEDYQDLEDIEMDDLPAVDNAATEAQARSLSSASLTTGVFLKEIVRIHRTVFEEQQDRTTDIDDFDRRYEVAQTILQILGHDVTKDYDAATVTGHLYRVCRAYAELVKKPVSNSKQPAIVDVAESCVEEVLLVQTCLLPLKARLDALLQEWTDNPLLCQLREICCRILSFPVTVPVKKVLTGLELLLAKAQIWEQTAASSVTLSSELNQVHGLTVRWQRMELESWKTLLERQITEQAAEAYHTWFHIFRIVTDTAKTLNAVEVMTSLEEYLITSTIGEFTERLEILASFQKQLQRTRKEEGITQILHNLITVYRQYQPLVKESVENGLSEIRKELHDFVKLQRWEDKGYYVMKTNAERAQRKLHRLCHKVKEALKRPCASVLAQIAQTTGYNSLQNLHSAETPHIDLRILNDSSSRTVSDQIEKTHNLWQELSLSTAPSEDSQSRFLQLPRITSRMVGLLEESPAMRSLSSVSTALNETCVSILHRLHQLQKDRNKGAQGRKKKALSDFFKYLLEFGISKRKSDIPKQEQSVVSWLEKPVLNWSLFMDDLNRKELSSAEVTNVREAFEKSDSYYYKCIDRMRRIWNAKDQPSKDVSLVEIQAMVHSAEHFLYLLRTQREMLRNFIETRSQLDMILIRLRELPDIELSRMSNRQRVDPPLPNQRTTTQWVDAQWGMFTRLQTRADEMLKLLMSVSVVEDHASQQASLTKSIAQLNAALDCVSHCFASLRDAQKGMEGWISYTDAGALRDNFLRIKDLKKKLERSQSDLSGNSDLEELSLEMCVRSRREFLSIVDSECQLAETLLSNESLITVPSSSGTSAVNFDQFREGLDTLISNVMLWTQTHHHINQRSLNDESSLLSVTDIHSLSHSCFGFQRLHQILQGYEQLMRDLIIASEQSWSIYPAPVTISETIKASHLLASALSCTEPIGSVVLDALTQIGLTFLNNHCQFSKLCYVSMNIILGVISDGFCTVEEGDQMESDGQGNFEQEEGTGMADGEGRKDVSDEIENEDQIIGTCDTEQQNDQENPKPEDDSKGIEMEQDFNGQYTDIQQQERPESEEEQDPADDDTRLEDEMGKVGEEGETVDERLWDGEEDDDEQETLEGHQGKGNSSEYAEGELDKQERSETDFPNTEQRTIERENGEAEEDEETTDQEGSEAEGQPSTGFTKPNEQEQELQLDEELKLDGDKDNVSDSLDDDIEHDNRSVGTYEPPIEKFAQPDEEPAPIHDDNHLSESDSETTPDNPQETKHVDGMDMEIDTEDHAESLSSREDMVVPDERTRDVDGNEGDGDMGNPSGPSQEAAVSGQQEGALDNDAEGLSRDEAFHSRIDEVMNHYETAPQSGPSAFGSIGGAREGASASTNIDQHPNTKQEEYGINQRPNPLRRLGDALESWKADLSVVDTNRSKQERIDETATVEETGDAMEYEFVQGEEDLLGSSRQALANATEEQMSQMVDLNGDHVQQNDDEVSTLDAHQSSEALNKVDAKVSESATTARQQFTERIDSESEMNVDSATDQSEIIEDVAEITAQTNSHVHIRLSEENEPEAETDETRSNERNARQSQSTAMDLAEGQRVWNRCQTATAELASELTEHLRLILEPTLASRLAGDYRTGKRINMKRVIPYIASQFRRDKIWLRRTKPDKRTYQVLLAIDDSKSMSENDCGVFALEALTLLSRAMSRLEVGELGLLSFGGSGKMTMLHPLGTPFSDSNGPEIVQQMHFNQDNRIEDQPMLNLMQSLQQILETAKQMRYSTRQQLHQLVIIVADGRFHEKSEMKRQVYDLCSRPGVLVSFIILDNPQHSVLDLSTVSFQDGIPQFRRYLEDFPFPYYIVLNDIAALPRTMADLLRQWFQISTTNL